MASTPRLRIPPEHFDFVDDDVEMAIRNSRRLLDIKEDDEIACTESTLERAGDFLRRNATNARLRYGVRIKAPVISPGPDGSIDILWKTGKRELLVNVPACAEEAVSYYGNDRTDPDAPVHNTVEGIADLAARNDWLLVWLDQ